EHEIGCNVLGRKPDFNPYDDNIVRVQISHLRKKLEEYFSSDGKDETVQIRIPRGAYLPRFEPHQQAPVVTETVFLKPKERRRALPLFLLVSAPILLAVVI